MSCTSRSAAADSRPIPRSVPATARNGPSGRVPITGKPAAGLTCKQNVSARLVAAEHCTTVERSAVRGRGGGGGESGTGDEPTDGRTDGRTRTRTIAAAVARPVRTAFVDDWGGV